MGPSRAAAVVTMRPWGRRRGKMQTLQAPHWRVSDSKGTTPVAPNIWNVFSKRYHNTFSEHSYRTVSSLLISLNVGPSVGPKSGALPYPVTRDHQTTPRSHNSLQSQEASPISAPPGGSHLQVLNRAASPRVHRTRQATSMAQLVPRPSHLSLERHMWPHWWLPKWTPFQRQTPSCNPPLSHSCHRKPEVTASQQRKVQGLRLPPRDGEDFLEGIRLGGSPP